MDIDILLILQRFRNGAGGVFASFFSKMTYLGETPAVILIMAVIYWSLDRRTGTYLMLGWSMNRLLNGLLKVTVCAYRPWIRDARIIPYGDSVTTATGYSFPSGHSANAASVYGGMLIRKDLSKALRYAMGALVLLVPFSRIYLGVHTPQDAAAGTAAGLMTMIFSLWVMKRTEADPAKERTAVITVLIMATAVSAYAALKSYPEDYVDGKLIVDGTKMARDTFKGAGGCCGFLAGWMLQRRFAGFSTDVPMGVRVSRSAAGIPFFYAVDLIIAPAVSGLIGGAAGAFIEAAGQETPASTQ